MGIREGIVLDGGFRKFSTREYACQVRGTAQAGLKARNGAQEQIPVS